MTRSFPRCLCSVGAVLPLLVLFLSAGSANASCGDYVIIGDGHAKQQLPAPAAPVSHPQLPCNGPLCQRQNDAPLTPPASVQISHSDDCCCFVPVRVTLTTQIEWIERSSFRPQRVQFFDIFHPPRSTTV